MREIKFRVWCKGKIYYPKDMRLKIDYGGFVVLVDKKYQPKGNYVLMQFTELLDKNGEEIWEGDIVKDNPKSPNWEVFWGKNYGWAIRAKNIYDPSTKHRIYRKLAWLAIRKEIEKIGNIYENKDLLK